MEFEINPMSGHISIPVSVNREGPFRFTLDTGAVATTLSTSFAEMLGIETHEDPDKKYQGLGFSYKMARLDEFSVGTLLRMNEEVIVFDLDAFLGARGQVSGNIGHSTLKDYVLTINYQKKTLRLEKPSEVPEEIQTWIPFNYVDNTHLIGVEVSINGKDPVELVLDTGSPVVILTPNLANEIGLSLGEGGPMVKGLGGMTQSHSVTLEQLAVGSNSQSNANALVLDLSAVSRRGNNLRKGILGASFLNKYELVIDYPNKRLALKHPSTQ